MVDRSLFLATTDAAFKLKANNFAPLIACDMVLFAVPSLDELFSAANSLDTYPINVPSPVSTPLNVDVNS